MLGYLLIVIMLNGQITATHYEQDGQCEQAVEKQLATLGVVKVGCFNLKRDFYLGNNIAQIAPDTKVETK